MSITFTTRQIPAEADAPAIAAHVLTGEVEIKPTREGKWWSFDINLNSEIRNPKLTTVHVAPADWMNVKPALAQAAVDLLIARRMEALAEKEPDARDGKIA